MIKLYKVSFCKTNHLDGSLIMATPVHPLFLCIPYLSQADSASRFMTAEDLFSSANCLSESERFLPAICDTKQAGDVVFYRYSTEKCLQWLLKRVAKAAKGIVFKIDSTSDKRDRKQFSRGGSATRSSSVHQQLDSPFSLWILVHTLEVFHLLLHSIESKILSSLRRKFHSVK